MILILLTKSSESHDLDPLFLLGCYFVCSLLIEFIVARVLSHVCVYICVRRYVCGCSMCRLFNGLLFVSGG